MNMSFDLYPFRHWVIDDYLHPTLLNRLLSEVPPADDPRWVSYSNVVEKKKALADWHAFGPATYHFFTDMCGEQVGIWSRLTGIEDLFPTTDFMVVDGTCTVTGAILIRIWITPAIQSLVLLVG
jgi:hypothetical protein